MEEEIPDLASPLSPEDKQIRKLRKKLRQIERLQLGDRELNEEELLKVKSKRSLRKELRNLLKDLHPDEIDVMKRQGASLPEIDIGSKKARNEEDINIDESQEHDADDIVFLSNEKSQEYDADDIVFLSNEKTVNRKDIDTCLDASSKVDQSLRSSSDTSTKISTSVIENKVRDKTSSETCKGLKVTTSTTTKSVNGQSSAGKESKEKSLWRDTNYQVFTLEGHNDIILSVDCKDELILSASRDTTVKVWRVCSTREERSLRGHTAAVTAVTFLPGSLANYVLKELEACYEDLPPGFNQKSSASRILAISGSLDCTIRVWDVKSGEGFGSIYTYNGISVMRCGKWGAVTGTEGGKLEVWCIATRKRLAFINAFEYEVTALHIDGDLIYAGSAEGEVGIWRFDTSPTRSLRAVFIMEAESHLHVPLRRLAAVVAQEGIMYFGDSGPNVKVLDWKKGNVTRLINHIGDIGMTDSLALSSDGHLLSSSYFVDTGCPSINVRERASGKYICSLIDEDEGRYLAISTAPGIVVSGGHMLKVWIQGEIRNISKKNKNKGEVVYPNVLRKLSGKAVESASEEDTDWASSDEDDNQQRGSIPNKASRANSENPSSWWCNIL